LRKSEAIQYLKERLRNVNDESVILFAHLIEEVHDVNFTQRSRYFANNREDAVELLAGFFHAGRQAMAHIRPIIQHIIHDMDDDISIPTPHGHA
jgi:hypothetical protein